MSRTLSPTSGLGAWSTAISGRPRDRAGGTAIPVKYVSLTPAEEDLILATLDQLTGMATTDRGKLKALPKKAKLSDRGTAHLEKLSGTGFAPSTRPGTAAKAVTDKDLEKKRKGAEGAVQADRRDDALRCPECGTEFHLKQKAIRDKDPKRG